ncbi:MAG: hypothetical protein ABR611_10475 [Chthoniobacterales bacterium]
MSVFFQHLRDPEYMHVLLNPLPVYGLSIAVLALALAIVFRSRAAVIVALIVIIISGMSAWPVLSYGQAAYDGIKSMSDPAGEQWLDEHMARGEQLIYAFYFLAALAAAGILLPYKWPRSAGPLAIATLAFGAATLGIGGWISYAGGHIRHKEFRFEPPPPPRKEHEHGAEMHEHKDATEQGTAPTTQKPAEMASPMEHGEHKQMQSPGQQPMEHGEHQQMQAQPGASPQPSGSPSEAEQKQLEASRLQLEASQKQLEASRKQLEATGAANPSPSPGASPAGSPSPSASEHKHDEHPH